MLQKFLIFPVGEALWFPYLLPNPRETVIFIGEEMANFYFMYYLHNCHPWEPNICVSLYSIIAQGNMSSTRWQIWSEGHLVPNISCCRETQTKHNWMEQNFQPTFCHTLTKHIDEIMFGLLTKFIPSNSWIYCAFFTAKKKKNFLLTTLRGRLTSVSPHFPECASNFL